MLGFRRRVKGARRLSRLVTIRLTSDSANGRPQTDPDDDLTKAQACASHQSDGHGECIGVESSNFRTPEFALPVDQCFQLCASARGTYALDDHAILQGTDFHIRCS